MLIIASLRGHSISKGNANQEEKDVKLAYIICYPPRIAEVTGSGGLLGK
jgi:hypothetical protein